MMVIICTCMRIPRNLSVARHTKDHRHRCRHRCLRPLPKDFTKSCAQKTTISSLLSSFVFFFVVFIIFFSTSTFLLLFFLNPDAYSTHCLKCTNTIKGPDPSVSDYYYCTYILVHNRGVRTVIITRR